MTRPLVGGEACLSRIRCVVTKSRVLALSFPGRWWRPASPFSRKGLPGKGEALSFPEVFHLMILAHL